LLQSTATRLEESLATALQILEANPDHLLGLSAAAEVAAELGRTEEATAHYQHIVDVYDAQMATQLVEYLDHGGITNNLRNVAEAFLAGG
jgi:tetratricopeptide (TPR) repeat protein